MTTAVNGCGSKLQYYNGSAYVTIAQLRTIKHENDGSKLAIIDQTNISTPGNTSQKIAGRFDSGEMSFDGVTSPQDATQLSLGTMHAAGTLASWRVLFSDGVTVWTFQGLVSNYKPIDLAVAKAAVFSGRIAISGAMTGPAGAV